jgi:hypothetical protein
VPPVYANFQHFPPINANFQHFPPVHTDHDLAAVVHGIDQAGDYHRLPGAGPGQLYICPTFLYGEIGPYHRLTTGCSGNAPLYPQNPGYRSGPIGLTGE